MELRKDPITRSWVITGDEVADALPRPDAPCRFCADAASPPQVIASRGEIDGVPWSARSVSTPHRCTGLRAIPHAAAMASTTACVP